MNTEVEIKMASIRHSMSVAMGIPLKYLEGEPTTASGRADMEEYYRYIDEKVNKPLVRSMNRIRDWALDRMGRRSLVRSRRVKPGKYRRLLKMGGEAMRGNEIPCGEMAAELVLCLDEGCRYMNRVLCPRHVEEELRELGEAGAIRLDHLTLPPHIILHCLWGRSWQ